MAATVEGVFRIIDKASGPMRRMQAQAVATDAAINRLGRNLDKVGNARQVRNMQNADRAIRTVRNETDQLGKSASGAAAASGKTERALSSLGQETDRLARRTRGARLETETFVDRLIKAGATILATAKILQTLKLPLMGAGIGFLVQLVGSLAGGLTSLVPLLVQTLGVVAAAPATFLAMGLAMGTVKLAMGGLQQALAGNAQALSQLTPAGHQFLAVLRLFRPVVRDLRESAQAGLFPGLTQALLESQQAVPSAQHLLFGEGQAIGQGAAGITQRLLEPQNLEAFNRVGQQAIGITRMAMSGIGNVLEALLHVADAARPFTNWLAHTILGWTQWAEQATYAGQASGRLARYFDHTQAALTLIGHVLKNVFLLLRDVGKAASATGTSMWQGIERATRSWEKWTASIGGQYKLRQYFASTQAVMGATMKLVDALGVAIAKMGMQPNIANTVDHVRAIIPAVTQMLNTFVTVFLPVAIDTLGQAVKIIGYLTSAVGPINVMLVALNKLLGLFTSLMDHVAPLRWLFTTLFEVVTLGLFISKLSKAIRGMELFKSMTLGAAAAQRTLAQAEVVAADVGVGSAARVQSRAAAAEGVVVAESAATRGVAMFPSVAAPRGSRMNPLVGVAGQSGAAAVASSATGAETRVVEQVAGAAIVAKLLGPIRRVISRVPGLGRFAPATAEAAGATAAEGAAAGAVEGGAAVAGGGLVARMLGAGSLMGAGRVALGTAGRVLWPITALMGLFGGLTAHREGSFGAQVAQTTMGTLSGATAGLLPKALTAVGVPKFWETSTDKANTHLQKLLDQTTQQLDQFGGASPQTFKDVIGEIGVYQRAVQAAQMVHTKAAQAAVTEYEQQLKVLRQVVTAEQNRRKDALVSRTNQQATRFARGLAAQYNSDVRKGVTPEAAQHQVLSHLMVIAKTLPVQARRILLQEGLTWVTQSAHLNPDLQGNLSWFSKKIPGMFDELHRKVTVSNGRILRGTARDWRAIASAMTTPLESATELQQKQFTKLENQAVAWLETWGFTPKQAKAYVQGLEPGNYRGQAGAMPGPSTPRGGAATGVSPQVVHTSLIPGGIVAGAIGQAVGGGLAGMFGGAAGRAASKPQGGGSLIPNGGKSLIPLPNGGKSLIPLGPPAIKVGASGMRIPGAGREDTVPLVLGMAAPGELIVNRHTEKRVDQVLQPVGLTLGGLVAGETKRHSEPVFATGGVVGAPRQQTAVAAVAARGDIAAPRSADVFRERSESATFALGGSVERVLDRLVDRESVSRFEGGGRLTERVETSSVSSAVFAQGGRLERVGGQHRDRERVVESVRDRDRSERVVDRSRSERFALGGSVRDRSSTVRDRSHTESSSSSSLRLTPGQTVFANQLSRMSGLDRSVVRAWVWNEQNGDAARSYQRHDYNNWLNVGNTDTGSYGHGDSVWSNPRKAARATYQWMQGSDKAVPGYPGAAPSISNWYEAAKKGEPPTKVISGLQQSGWASGAYPELQSVYREFRSQDRDRERERLRMVPAAAVQLGAAPAVQMMAGPLPVSAPQVVAPVAAAPARFRAAEGGRVERVERDRSSRVERMERDRSRVERMDRSRMRDLRTVDRRSSSVSRSEREVGAALGARLPVFAMGGVAVSMPSQVLPMAPPAVEVGPALVQLQPIAAGRAASAPAMMAQGGRVATRARVPHFAVGGRATSWRGFPAPHEPVRAAADQVLEAFPGLVVTSTTQGNHVQGSYHYQGEAVDISGAQELMDRAGAWMAKTMTPTLTEGIHNDTLSVKYGKTVDPSFWGGSTWAGHVNHIHMAVADGTSVPPVVPGMEPLPLKRGAAMPVSQLPLSPAAMQNYLVSTAFTTLPVTAQQTMLAGLQPEGANTTSAQFQQQASGAASSLFGFPVLSGAGAATGASVGAGLAFGSALSDRLSQAVQQSQVVAGQQGSPVILVVDAAGQVQVAQTFAQPVAAPVAQGSAVGQGSGVGATGTTNTTEYFKQVLSQMGLPDAPNSVAFLNAWAHREGVPQDIDAFNLLGTTLQVGASYGTNKPGVQHYSSFADGVHATASMLDQSNFSEVRKALASGDPYKFANDPEIQREFSSWSGGGYTWPIVYAQGGRVVSADTAAAQHFHHAMPRFVAPSDFRQPAPVIHQLQPLEPPKLPSGIDHPAHVAGQLPGRVAPPEPPIVGRLPKPPAPPQVGGVQMPVVKMPEVKVPPPNQGGMAPVFAGWHADGFDGMVTRPTLFGAGEDGPERVVIQPQARRREVRSRDSGLVIQSMTINHNAKGDTYEQALEEFHRAWRDFGRELDQLPTDVTR